MFHFIATAVGRLESPNVSRVLLKEEVMQRSGKKCSFHSTLKGLGGIKFKMSMYLSASDMDMLSL